jgi:dTDP-4-amino-4,6-dideoxygalactose transaminase
MKRILALPPLDGPIDIRDRVSPRGATDAAALRAALAARFGARHAALFASGREALRVAMHALAKRSGRGEAVLPAYTCWSVAAAAVAAGLRVRLVDVDARGQIDLAALHALPLERVACVVVSNLFGVAEPLAPIAAVAHAGGAAVIDDAAQSPGAEAADGVAGSRGDVAMLSFGRGKPIQALGGGALVWRDDALGFSEPMAPLERPRLARLHAHLWNLALSSPVFSVLAAVPAFGVGRTSFDPEFRRGAIGGDALVLVALALEEFDARALRRTTLAESMAADLARRTRFEPLRAPLAHRAMSPRLAVLAPDAASRNRALATLARCGASSLYPAALDTVPALAPHRSDMEACPGARALASRLLTFPLHGRLDGSSWERCVCVLADLSEGRGL